MGSALKFLVEWFIVLIAIIGWFDHSQLGLFSSLLAAIGMGMAAAVVQRFGILVAARLQGMAIWNFRIWPLEFEPQRRG